MNKNYIFVVSNMRNMDEEDLIKFELENQKFMGMSLMKKYIYTMNDQDFLLYYYNKYIKDIKDKSFKEFKKTYKNKKDIEKLKIEIINIEIKSIEDGFKLINH